MGYSTPFTSAQLQEIPNETPLAETINFSGYTGWIVTNATPATFLLLDDNEIVQGKIDAWSKGQGSLPTSTTTITLQADYSWPVSNPEGVAATQFQLSLESAQSMLPPYSVTLAVANAIPSVIVNSAGETLVAIPAGSTIQITQAAGEELVINGNVTANIPAGSTIAVTTAAGTSLNIGSVQSITETINASTVNEVLNVNSLIFIGTIGPFTITNLVAGGYEFNVNVTGTLGYFGGFVLNLTSGNSLANKYSITPNNGQNNPISLFNASHVGGYNYTGIPVSIPSLQTGGSDTYAYAAFSCTPHPANGIAVTLNNISGATIASDTIWIDCYGVLASEEIVNPTSAPVYQQASVGSFDSFGFVSGTWASGDTSLTLFSSSNGGYITSVELSFENGETYAIAFEMTIGTATYFFIIPPAVANAGGYNVPGMYYMSLKLGNGTPNNGVAIGGPTYYGTAPASGTTMVLAQGYIVYTQQNALIIPATIT